MQLRGLRGRLILVAIPILLLSGTLLAQLLATRNLPINGTYWISLPASPNPPITNAEELLSYGPFASVARFRTETNLFHTWTGGTCTNGKDPDASVPGAPCTTDCFCVIPGEGYQVTVTGAPVDWNINGYDGVTVYPLRPAGPQSLTGQHLISLPTDQVPGFANASNLIEDINFQAGTGIVRNVARYLTNSSTIQVYDGSSGIAFPLVAGEGYRVEVDGPLDYMPPQPGTLAPCIEPDVDGTIHLPPEHCGYLSGSKLHMILDNLPPGTEVVIDAVHGDFSNVMRSGARTATTTESFTSDLVMHITGTGGLAIDCTLTISPVAVVVESDPAQPGQDVQEFDTDMRSLSGDLIDEEQCDLFEELHVLAGSDHGLPSPGHTRLERRPDGTFDVYSSFDVTNTISYVGKKGSLLQGRSGSTTTTLTMGTASTPGEAGNPIPLLVTDYNPVTDELSLSYGPACGSDEHDIYFGPLGQVASLGWSGAECSIGDTGAYGAFDPAIGSFFFVVVGHDNDGHEGSYGKSSDGQERPAFPGSSCAREQVLANSCP